MNNISINFANTFANLSALREHLFSFLTPQQKRIILIASFALGCLTACIVISRCLRQKKIVKSDDSSDLINLEQKDEKSFLQLASSMFKKADKVNSSQTAEKKVVAAEVKVDSAKESVGVYETKTLADGTLEEGFFVDGKLNGQGKRKSSFKEEVGFFQEGLFTGKGKKTTIGGIEEDGIFIDSILNGEGTRTYPDGMRESGTFVNGQLHGKGTLYNKIEQLTDKGDFEHGRLHGIGTRVDGRDKSKLVGKFERGEWKEPASLAPVWNS